MALDIDILRDPRFNPRSVTRGEDVQKLIKELDQLINNTNNFRHIAESENASRNLLKLVNQIYLEALLHRSPIAPSATTSEPDADLFSESTLEKLYALPA